MNRGKQKVTFLFMKYLEYKSDYVVCIHKRCFSSFTAIWVGQNFKTANTSRNFNYEKYKFRIKNNKV